MVRYAKHVGPECENAHNLPTGTFLSLLKPEGMIHSPALLLPHKAARAAPTAGGTSGKFRGAVITRDWLLCAVTDRLALSELFSVLLVDSLQKSTRHQRITETLSQLLQGPSVSRFQDGKLTPAHSCG